MAAQAADQKPKRDDQILTLDCSVVKPDPNQPREYFDPATLQTLAASIRQVGQKQPIIVARLIGVPPHEYEIVDGERRFRAITEVLHYPTIQAVLRQYASKNEQYIDSIVSNLPREGHSTLELLHAFQRLRDMGKCAIEIAEICGCTFAWVYQVLSLQELVPEVLALLNPALPKNERLKTTVALELAKVKKRSQLLMAQTVIKQQLKIGRAKQYIKTHRDAPKPSTYHSPRKDLAVIDRRIKRMEEDAGVIWSMLSGRGLDRIFSSRSEEEKRAILDNALTTQQKLDRIINTLSKVDPGKKIISAIS